MNYPLILTSVEFTIDDPGHLLPITVYYSLLRSFVPDLAKLFKKPGVRVKLNVSFSVMNTFMYWLRQEYERAPSSIRPTDIIWQEMHATQYFIDKVFYATDSKPVPGIISDVKDAEAFIENFLLADTYNIITFRLDAIHRLIDCFVTSFEEGSERDEMKNIDSRLIRRVYDTTGGDSPVRKVLVAGLSRFTSGCTELSKDVPLEFFLDVMKELAKQGGKRILSAVPLAYEFPEPLTQQGRGRCERHKAGWRD